MATQPASIERAAGRRRPARTALPDWRREQGRAFALGLLPALLVLVAITLGPTIYLIVTSLTPLDPVQSWTKTRDFPEAPPKTFRQLWKERKEVAR